MLNAVKVKNPRLKAEYDALKAEYDIILHKNSSSMGIMQKFSGLRMGIMQLFSVLNLGIMQKYGKITMGIMQNSSPRKETPHVQTKDLPANGRMEEAVPRTVGAFNPRRAARWEIDCSARVCTTGIQELSSD